MSDRAIKHKSIRKKSSARKKAKKPSSRKTIFIFVVRAFIAVLLLAFLFFFVVYLGFTGHVPTTAQLHVIKSPQASEVYSADGRLLGRYYIENRSNVHFQDISPHVINALVATEDARFYEHRGIDEMALLRVLVKTILFRDRSSGGGSTLSQQIAKNLFPRNDFGILSMPVNKLREAIIAYRLERIYTKEEILTLYLNTVPFAENIFGVEVAAERFFNKKPSSLMVDEAAVLVGMLKANNFYNPRTNPERSKDRRDVVIAQMVENGFLTEEEGRSYQSKPIELRYTRISYNEGPAPEFLEMLKPELLEWCASHTKENGDPWNLYTDGLRIQTTINADYQLYARQAVVEHMKVLQETFNNHWANSDPWRRNSQILERAIRRSDRYKKMAGAGFSEGHIEEAFQQKITTELFTWDGVQQVETTPLDSIKHYLRFLNTGFLALDPGTGDLKAWIGGIDFRFFKYDHVLSERQVGSTFKPFVYLSALENGLSPYDYYPAAQQVYSRFQNWSPSNADGVHDGFYSMEGALSQSVNTVAAHVMVQTGVGNVISTVRELGLEADLPKVPSLALGVASVSLKDLLFAYATLINDGKRVEPYYLQSIANSEGIVLEEFARPLSRNTSLSGENCRIITHMMETAVNKGTGTRIRSTYRIPGDFAGKTGTTQNHSDGWFVGLTPHLVTGCWVGAEEPGIHFRSITYGQGSYMALPIVGRFYSKLYGNSKYRDLQKKQFLDPSQEVLADLNIPAYKDILEMERPENILERLFAGKNKEEKLHEIQKPQETADEPKEKGLWKSIKRVFQKKDK
ncbi:MAG: transglycosylase domain-containing protein [Mariniphaga sp.]|nr:transglycosylase domain-containing protein [Mariniphaga sp.]MDD4225557.1 transglycosylase domain-containing protein [Mariniphaga sp.]